MRRTEFQMSRAQALAFLSQAPSITVSGTTGDGELVQKVLHGVVVNEGIVFHGAPIGEKTGLVGQPVVVTAFEALAEIPSTFTHSTWACPATTFYRSVQVRGTLTAIDGPANKAAGLQSLMERFQPEGGYVPITADEPMYRAPVANLLLGRICIEEISGKEKLGQNKSAAKMLRIVQGLWNRGRVEDLRAIRAVIASHPDPIHPAFLNAPDGYVLHPWATETELDAVAELLAPEYWHVDVSPDARRGALTPSSGIVATTSDGGVVGFARVVSDRTRRGWLYDVIVSPGHRGRGLGKALVRTALEHPLARDCGSISLGTRDAMSLYGAFGFRTTRTIERPGSGRTHEMVLRRTYADAEEVA